MTARFAIVALILMVSLTGCRRNKSQPAERAETPEERRAANEAGFRKNIPVLDRTIVTNDLSQLHLFMMTARTNKWLTGKETADAIRKDADFKKMASQIDDGTYVIVDQPADGGIIAYCSKETTLGQAAVRASGEITFHKPDELKALLAQQKR